MKKSQRGNRIFGPPSRAEMETAFEFCEKISGRGLLTEAEESALLVISNALIAILDPTLVQAPYTKEFRKIIQDRAKLRVRVSFEK